MLTGQLKRSFDCTYILLMLFPWAYRFCNIIRLIFKIVDITPFTASIAAVILGHLRSIRRLGQAVSRIAPLKLGV